MLNLLRIVSLLVCLSGQAAVGMVFDEEQFFEDGNRDAQIPDQKLFGKKVKWGSCGRYVVKNLEGAGCRFPYHSWMKQFLYGVLMDGNRDFCHYQGDVPSSMSLG